MEASLTLEELAEEFELDLEEFLYEELMANEEVCQKYLPKDLLNRLFDEHGEVSLQEMDDTLLQEISAFRQETEKAWMKTETKIRKLWHLSDYRA